MLKVSLKFSNTWQVIDSFSVLDDYTISMAYFSARDFKGELEHVTLGFKLSGALFNKFLHAGEKIPILIEDDSVLIFGGFLENVFSTQETPVVGTQDFFYLNLKARSWLSWFDFEIQETFNPYVDLLVVEPLPVCDPFNPSRSILHKLWTFLSVPFVLSRDLVLKQKTYSFVIKEKENVLKALQELFWELTYFMYIDAHGIFYACEICSACDPKKIPLLKSWGEFSLVRCQKEASFLKLEWASVLYKSRTLLESEKKAIYSEASGSLDENGCLEPLITLVPQADYPPFSTYNETYQRPSARFLQTNYTWDYIEEGIFGRQSAVNEDLSLIALWDFHLVFKADAGLKKQYFRYKSDSFAFSFINPLPLSAHKDPKECLLNLHYLDVYASCLYRTKRNFIQNRRVPIVRSYPSLDNCLAKEEKEIFLRYVNDRELAQKFFNLHANRLLQEGLSFRFSSLHDLKLNSFCAINSCGQTFYCLITQKTRQKTSSLFVYEAIQNLPLKLLDSQESQEGGSWERPTPVYDYYLASRWSSHKGNLRTDYLHDENLLVCADSQTQVFGGRLIFSSSLFFVGSHTFVSECVSKNEAVLRHRPLSPPLFKQKSSLRLCPRKGVIVRSCVLKEAEPIKKGHLNSLFKIS